MSRLIRAVALSAFALALAPGAASADVFKPTRHDDPPPGRCKPRNCSFREALIAANSTPNKKDTVVLGKGTYKLQIPPGGTPFRSGEFSVFTPVTIRGQGPGKTRIDGNGIDRVIAIGSGITAFGRVNLRNLTVTGGDAGATGVPHDSEGGGIAAFGEAGSKLVLTNVVVRGNEAQFGGGIQAYREQVNITRSTIRGNSGTEGGGLHVIASPSPATLVNVSASTISGNSASKGGGILADGSTFWGPNPPTVVLLNSTVAGNTTTAEAGGVMADNDATVGVYNSTVAYNGADVDNTGGGNGGGIHQHSGATFLLNDSIVDQNTVGTSGSDTACSGTFSGDGNVVTAGGGCSSLNSGTNRFVGGAEIFPLADNGGPTQTIKLKSSSPALGFATQCPKTDQRGKLRPATGCDSGAFERDPIG